MKRIVFLVALAFFTFSYTPRVMALDFIGAASYWDPDDADGAWGLGLGVALPLFTEIVRLDGRVYFFESSDIGDDGGLDLIPLDLGLQVHLLPHRDWDPYLMGGLSYIYADADRVDVDSELGGYLGGGVEYAWTSAVKPFGELTYRFAELDSDRGIRNEDVDVSGVTANIGLKLHL